ncbi:VOC family protein [Mycolicibacterium flavescens]|uniref:Glyoxalase n=1 Tax=Mycolicibacterium flavescens TaxID=1776 RepID=A0A1E3RJL4_MYCFV|nr:VOC family protein [Mycolicibacterium flavescens]MCV7280567.1 VOC family protein [Mycolicibacterium flavescens]ODQ90048.1 glyoxalase [Mycolicibacterium flavescens]
MTLAAVNITIDTTDPDALAQWWATALDGQLNPLAPGFFVTVALPGGPGLAFQKVDDPTPGKNRVHLDFGAADVEAEVQRLVGLGATETGRHSMGDFGWVVLADPDGNAFCVAPADHP